MHNKTFILLLAPLALSGAQWDDATAERQATIRGGGGSSGKCTIEVEVDGIAEVEIRGDRGRIRTLQGNPSTWRRFECNQVLPLDPANFRFRGIDGRGRQELVSFPGGRRSAVVRIEDPKGGSHGYTFDLEWRGSGGGTDSGWGGQGGSGGGWGGSGGGWGGSGSSGSGWGGPGGGWGGSGGRELRYSGRGSGVFSNANGLRDELSNCRVYIDLSGNAEVTFLSQMNGNVTLRGQVVRVSGNRIEANMSGNGISGGMTLTTSGPNRVREINMSGRNPVRFDLQWRE